MTALPEKKQCTIEDIEALPEGKRAELINGDMYMLAAPLRIHQEISEELMYVIQSHIRNSGKHCKAYSAPFAVYLDENYVEPDISVICDLSKLTDKGCKGAPDWIIEILSPTSATNDYVRKLALYERTGVREYWIVNPEKRKVHTYFFENDNTINGYYSFEELIPVSIYEGFAICIENLL